VASRKLGHGDLSARVEPGGVEEIALTGSAFNQMAEEIEQHVGQLHELSVARSRFVSSVSHELRTPITSLRGYLELLSQGEAGPLEPDQMRFVEVADRNARQLSDLIDDLLTLSRVQSGRMSLRADGVNVRDLLHDLKSEMMPIGSERGVDVVLVDTGDLIVEGDAMRLRQAFGNLLSNSIKYSRDGQAVVVRALAVDRQAVISFVDWGMGIPREDLPQIAEPFFRSASSEGVPGTGLGLAIAKQMIELHGGRLAVESELGSGSTFTVYLPLDVLPSSSADEEPPLAQSATTSGD
ncbi:MAG: sensor histidine kinase, partial [Solirubrobacterales bacterium]